jgi:tetratricopeptide (TPR) repeat protein
MPDMVSLLLEGLAHQRAGRLVAAEAAYTRVLDADPDQPHALHCLGLLALGAKRIAAALDLLSRASAARPDDTKVRAAYGRALLAAGRATDAVALFEAQTQERPLCPVSQAHLALARLRAGDPSGALAASDAALRLDRSNPEAWFARGTALARLGRAADAVTALEQAAVRAPLHAEAHLNLGNALFDLDRRNESEAALRRAVALDPTLAEAHASLGCLLTGNGRLAEAVDACERAIALRPDFAQAHWNQSFAHMRAGDYAAGWEKYEWRKRHDAFARDLMLLPGPEWHGEPVAGRIVLVRAEQGLGDTIQFARYLPMLVGLGAHVVLACPEPLLRLLGQIPGVKVVPRGPDAPPYDVWIDQMSLPRLFGTRPEAIPDAAGYLFAEADAVARWHRCLPQGLRVGIVWAGNPAHSNDRRRSMGIADVEPLLAVPGCRFVSLQVGPRAKEGEESLGLEDRSARLADLADTAALIAALDLVISVDSCVAHLAGALGVPVWILLPFAPDWRWLVGRADSPWYESARLFRQTRPGDWTGPIAAVAGALAAMAAQAASFATSAGAMRTSLA